MKKQLQGRPQKKTILLGLDCQDRRKILRKKQLTSEEIEFFIAKEEGEIKDYRPYTIIENTQKNQDFRKKIFSSFEKRGNLSFQNYLITINSLKTKKRPLTIIQNKTVKQNRDKNNENISKSKLSQSRSKSRFRIKTISQSQNKNLNKTLKFEEQKKKMKLILKKFE